MLCQLSVPFFLMGFVDVVVKLIFNEVSLDTCYLMLNVKNMA